MGGRNHEEAGCVYWETEGAAEKAESIALD